MRVTTIEMFKDLESKLGQETTEKFLTYIEQQNDLSMENNKDLYLTKDDKIDILNRMDAHFKWLVGIMLTAISLATVLAKLL